jgi:predicted nucleotidyltransferase
MPTELSKYLKLINQNIETLKNDFGVVQIAIFGSISGGESTKKAI